MNTASSSPPAFSLRAYLELIRLPLVFTAVADVLMGYLVTHDGIEPPAPLILLLCASCSFYWSGMVLNDVFDIEQDRKQRPQRPIPSGRVSLASAKRLGFLLLIIGLALAVAAGTLATDWRPPLIAGALGLCIVSYNRVLKRTPLAPLAMGGCRLLNVLLGMSTAAIVWQDWNLLIAGGIGIYVVGVTIFARTEAQTSGRGSLIAGLLVLLSGMALLAWLPNMSEPPATPTNWHFFWIMLSILIGWRCLRAIASPTPQLVQTAVRSALSSLIVLDAAVCFALCGREWALLILLLLFPSVLLGRWLYST